VGARFPAVTVPPSKGVAVPAAQGQGAGLPEGFGLAKTAKRHPPSVGPGCCPGWRRRWPPRTVGEGGPPGPRGHAPSPCGGPGGVSGGPVWPRWATRGGPGVGGGPPSMAPRPAPVRGGCYARPAGGGGAPLLLFRGAEWPGWARQAVPQGRRVWLPPPPPARWGGCHARPAGGGIQGGARSTPREATGLPC